MRIVATTKELTSLVNEWVESRVNGRSRRMDRPCVGRQMPPDLSAAKQPFMGRFTPTAGRGLE